MSSARFDRSVLARAGLALILVLPTRAGAEPTGPELTGAAHTAWYVETDPATFALGGFAAHVRVRLPGHARWSLGAGAYALDLPSPLVELDPANRDEGWTARIRLAAGVFVDRYLRDDGAGWFLGVQLGVQQLRVTRDAMAGRASFVDALVMPRVGYAWHPFDAGFYVLPWIGVGVTGRIAGDVQVGGERYDVFPIIAFATVHAGWQF